MLMLLYKKEDIQIRELHVRQEIEKWNDLLREGK